MEYTQTTNWNNSLPILILLLLTSISFSDTVSGKVTDLSGNPIPNVNIYSGNTGTNSDLNGDFQIDVNNETLLTFSHIGFESIQMKSNSNMVVILKTSNLLGKDVYVNSSLDQRDLYNTPSSVTLFNSKDLSVKSDVHFQGLIEQIPNLNYSSGTSRPRYFQIRGIGERSHYAGEGPPNYSVGFIMDGIDFSGIGMLGHLFDVNQIEIFKGPQSTVFGPNAIAGSINITTQNPTPFYSGKFESNFSNDNVITHSGAIGGPLLKSLAFRMSASSHSQNGFRKNVFLNEDDTNGKDEVFIRTKLLWQPLKNMKISFTNINAEMNNKYDAWSPDNNEDLITYTNQQGMDSQETQANAIHFEFPEFLGFKTEYKFTNSMSKMVHSYDGDWGNDSLWLNEYGFDFEVVGWKYEFWDETKRDKEFKTNEITVYSNNSLNLPFNGKLVTGIYTSSLIQNDNAIGWLFGGDATSLNSNFTIDNLAFYGNYLSRISNSLELNMNLRYESNDINYFANAENFYNSYYYLDVNLPEIDTSKTDNFSGGSMSLKNNINEKILIYGSISKGYKAGGINQNPYLNGDSRFYNPEYNLNLELGARITWNNMNTNLALFNMKRTDQQVQISTQKFEDDPNSFTYYTANATDGYNRGFEIETEINISDNLTISNSIGYLITHINEFSYNEFSEDDLTIITIVKGDREQAMSPKFNSSFNIHYSHHSGLFINGNVTSKDEYYFSDSHDEKSKSYYLFNVDLGYEKNNFRISLWGRNITDARYAVRGFYFVLEPGYGEKLYLSYGEPKEMGIKLSYQF